jgi:HprK-related kinase A
MPPSAEKKLRATGQTAHCLIGSFGVSLYSELPQVLRDFIALYPQRPYTDQSAGRVIRIEVLRAGRSAFGRSMYRITADGNAIGSQYPSYGVFPLVEWGINLRIMATRNEFVQLHAASMEYQGHGFVFAGQSGCGKSTLAATLLGHGWKYFCDEFALIEKDSLTLHPFPKALCIKAGSYSAVRKLGLAFARRRDYVKAFKGRVGYINPCESGGDRIASPTSVRFIIFPQFKADAVPTLAPMPRAEAATELYRCCFNKEASPIDALATLTELVRKTQCFRLVVGSAAETVRLLEDLSVNRRSQVSGTKEPRLESIHRPPKFIDRVASRREMLKTGAKLAYVAPCILTLSSQQAFAAASNPSGICSTASHTGQLCTTDMNCCSQECTLGVCR